MKNFTSRIRLAVGRAVLCSASAIYADTVSMKLTGVGNGATMGGVYVNPYDATINGTPVKVICDDFNASTYLNQTWTANAISFNDLAANIGLVRWGSFVGRNVADTVAIYNQAAYLSDKLLASPGNPSQGQISFAIWGLFNTSALNQLGADIPSNVNRQAAKALIDEAKAQSFTAGQYSNYTIYAPVTGLGTSPQEFLVRTPEPAAVAILALNMSALIGLVMFLRRRAIMTAC